MGVGGGILAGMSPTTNRRLLRSTCAALLAGCLFGCESVQTGVPLPESASPTDGILFADRRASAARVGSLFPADQAAISDAALAEILNSELRLPSDVRLAVVPVGQTPNFSGYSPDFAGRSRDIYGEFLGTLRDGSRVAYAQELPRMLRPQNVSVPQLRVAAARNRADVLLVVLTGTKKYENERMFGRDEVRAFSEVEAVLVDVRSGTIPFSTSTVEDFFAKRDGDDLNFADTIARANQEAVGKAWVRVAGEVAAYLDGLEDAPPRDVLSEAP
jgi:hypothetical protein